MGFVAGRRVKKDFVMGRKAQNPAFVIKAFDTLLGALSANNVSQEMASARHSRHEQAGPRDTRSGKESLIITCCLKRAKSASQEAVPNDSSYVIHALLQTVHKDTKISKIWTMPVVS